MTGNLSGGNVRTTVLITGFGPFPGVPVNASTRLLREVARAAPRLFPGVNFVTAVLATEWRAAWTRVDRLVADSRPDLVLHFGVSPRARGFEIEARARNACSPTPDASGAWPAAEQLEAGSAEHLLASVPVNHIAMRLRCIGIPAFVSRDAGAYLCNAALYHSLLLARAAPRRRVGFIHLPASLARQRECRRDGACPLTWEQAIGGAIEVLAACLGRPARHRLATSPAQPLAQRHWQSAMVPTPIPRAP
jgi:pyroglutamyl-peptidase